jgi:hypothetical protein
MFQVNKKYQILNGSILKITAIITMFIDHIGAAILYFIPTLFLLNPENHKKLELFYGISRNIGRIAFPLFCFLLVEGFVHTKNVKKYMLRLFVFALVSEFPFDLAFYDGLAFVHQNVFWTLLLGLITIYGIDWIIQFARQEQVDFSKVKNQVLMAIGLCGVGLIGGGISVLMNTDYSYHGVLLILIFYVLRHNRIMAGLIGYMTFVTFLYEPFCLPAFIMIQFYNGKKGLAKTKINYQYIFYAFYPVHLLILYLIRMLMS